MKPPLCLFHKNCLDGTAAAAVVARRFPTAEFLSVQYGAPPPTVEGREVYLVDFGYPVEGMRALRAQATAIHWIDHHASQVPVRETLGWGDIDTDESGSSLAWRLLFPGQPLPQVLAYVRDKDLWRWQLPDSQEICAGLSATFPGDRFRGLLEADLAAMAAKGRPLVEKMRARVAAAAAGGIAISRPFGRSGRALAVFVNRDQNEVGSHVCDSAEAGGLGYDLAILIWRKPTGQWVHSLRSGDGGLDCATIASERGGGGHPRSACFIATAPLITPPSAPVQPPA